MSSANEDRQSQMRGLVLLLCVAASALGQTPSKSVTFAVFKFHDVTLESQERGQNTEHCITEALVDQLNQKFRQRPFLKYWQFQTGTSEHYPYLLLSVSWGNGWILRLSTVDPKRGGGGSGGRIEEPIFPEGGATPSGCDGWKPALQRALNRLVVEDRETDVQKILQGVPVTETIKLLNNKRFATVPLPANSDSDLFGRLFVVDLINAQKRGGQMYPCGTGKPSVLSAEVSLSLPPNIVADYVKNRYSPTAVYLTSSCQVPGISVMPQ